MTIRFKTHKEATPLPKLHARQNFTSWIVCRRVEVIEWIMDDNKLVAIRSLLASPVQSESDVAYFLVEARKVIKSLPGNRFPILSFFCDWIVHPEMSWNSAKQVLGIFDQYIAEISKGGGEQAIRQATKKLGPLISFRLFRDELSLLLYELHVDTTLASAERFIPFLTTYVDIIARTPLIMKDQNSTLAHIDNLRIVKKNERHQGSPLRQPATFAFGMDWTLRKGEKVVAGVVNEVWIPHQPMMYRHPLLKVVPDGTGKLKRVPLEASTFID